MAQIGPRLEALLASDTSGTVMLKVELRNPGAYPTFPEGKDARARHKLKVGQVLHLTEIRHADLLTWVEREAKEHGTESSICFGPKYLFASLPAKAAGRLSEFPDVFSVELSQQWAPGPAATAPPVTPP